VFQAVDPRLRVTIRREEGARIKPGETILIVTGKAHSILAAERVALNFLGHLSGIATLTSRFIQQVRGTRTKIMDTRKTLPGLRLLEKYAVRIGGGSAHRMGLHDAVLIKTNHLKIMGQGARDKGRVIQRVVQTARTRYPHHPIEVEVTNLNEFRAALNAQPDMVLLDNMAVNSICVAVRLRNLSHVPRPMSPLLEVSGGVTLHNVRAIAKTGVDRISVGRLTHSAPSLDVSLEVIG
jgi:nicotinate-nucleotide pyrophosphorylase (carboxylating)